MSMRTRTRKRVQRSVSTEWECNLLDVFYSEKTDRTIVLYELGDGKFGDMATNIMRRTAWFIGKWNRDLHTEVLKVYEQDSYYYEGLPDSIADHEWEQRQTADEAAERAREEERLLSDPDRASGWYQRDLRTQQERHQAMMDALDRLEEAPDDESAMEAIYAAREQYALLHEK